MCGRPMCIIPSDVRPLVEEWILDDVPMFSAKECGLLLIKYGDPDE